MEELPEDTTDIVEVYVTKTETNRRCFICKKKALPADGRSLHKFPDRKADQMRFDAWRATLQLELLPPMTARICSEHFTIDQFYIMQNVNQRRLILLADAVPDTNLPTQLLTREELRKLQTKCKREERKKNQVQLKICTVAQIEDLYREPDYESEEETSEVELPVVPKPVSPVNDSHLDEELYVCVTLVRTQKKTPS